MKPTAFRYGLYGSLVLLGLFLLNYALLDNSIDYGTQEIIGYLTIVLSMIFIFFWHPALQGPYQYGGD